MARIPYEDEIIISWVELHRDSRYLAQILHEKGPWKGIIAITRGGLVPAGRPVIDVCIKEFKQNKWIHFPWDIEYRFATPIKEGGRVSSGP